MDAFSNEGESLRELAEQKEKEWKQLQDLRSQTLESSIRHKETQLAEERAKFFKLKEDFKYNLQLLNDRDNELDKYDANFKELRREQSEKDSELSDLRIELDEFRERLDHERQLVEEAQTNYQHRLKEKQAEVEEYRILKDVEIRRDREDIEVIKRKLERQLREMEGELDIQKRELCAGFDDAMKRREHEFQIKRDEMSNELLAAELKAKFLEKEVEALRRAQDETRDELTTVDENHRQLEKELKETSWKLKDVSAMKDARIRDLERETEKTKLTMDRIREDFERKHQNLDKHCREQDQATTAIRESRDQTERDLTNQIRDLQEQLNTRDIEMRNMEWTQKDMLEDKDRIIEKHYVEKNDMQLDWDRHIADLSKSTVHKDVELQQLMTEIEKLKSDLDQRKLDIDRYKKDMSMAVEREVILERSRAQLELDWQRKYEDVERAQYDKVEHLVHKLTTSRDEALADLRHKEVDLAHQQKLTEVLIRDRDAALSTLQHHGFNVQTSLHLESDDVISAGVSRDLENLREQNSKLKEVIKLMRDEMEKMRDARPQTQQPGGSPAVKEAVAVILNRDSDYVKNLEQEVQNLRCQLRGTAIQTPVTSQMTPMTSQKSEMADTVHEEMADNPVIRAHVQSLNDNIGLLRREKVEYAAQIKKLQARILHLENLNDQLAKQPRQKQLKVDQLQYELGAAVRRHETELSSLHQRIGQLDLELIQTRKEADVYYKGTLERNLEATSLGNEVSSLKMQLVQKQPKIAFGGQELLIQQLQDQISDLRSRHSNIVNTDPTPGDSSDPGGLKQKLKQAALYIQQLAKEKQQLIQVGNRMRAELLHAGIKLPVASAKPPSIPAPPVKHTPVEPFHHPAKHSEPATPYNNVLSAQIQNKLGQLEKLQYNLTKQELAFAQKGRHSVHVLHPSSSSESTPGVAGDRLFATGSTYQSSTMRSSPPSTLHASTQRTSSPGPDQPNQHNLGLSLSSVGGDSLQDLWRMVDEGPSELTSRIEVSKQHRGVEFSAQLPDPGGWLVKGQTINRTNQRAALSDKAAGRVTRNKAKQKTSQIRNYNVKD